ncbi:unnamed protein product [Didymodactylos carnosus]|uniref:Uncharacterized protein n=1 Tax=Didymodactylos carnosus TaxID=1234261 RepID=A0A815NWE2_9BILA|nr:unnamed protein product [Didymodactylos carnosus]CAF4318398.1 unnamed protein product [Didymodactylos carnosus]
MPTSIISKSNASQRIVATTASYQRQLSPQHQSSTQYQSLSIRQPCTQTTSYFAPVHQPHTYGPSYNQQHASPYTVNRREGGMSYASELDAEPVDLVDENIRPAHLVTINQNALDMLVERCSMLEKEMQTLQSKTDKVPKIALTSTRNEQLWNNQNLLEKPRTALPATYLCYPVRKMYTAEEIKSRVPQLQRTDECLTTSYFSHDPYLVDEFMSTKGRESLHAQERTKRSQEKCKAALRLTDNNKNIVDISSMNMNNSQDSPDIDIFNDI